MPDRLEAACGSTAGAWPQVLDAYRICEARLRACKIRLLGRLLGHTGEESVHLLTTTHSRLASASLSLINLRAESVLPVTTATK